MAAGVITSVHNPRLKNLVRLRDGSHRRRQRRFLIEGRREVERALDTGWEIEAVYYCPEYFAAATAPALCERIRARGLEMVCLGASAFAKVSQREGPDGFLACANMRAARLDDLQPPPDALLVVVEGVEKPGNLGALLRTANAAGATAVLVANPVTDVTNPNAIRASQGAFFDLPVVSSDNETIQLWLAEHGVTVIVTAPAADRPIWDFDLRGRIALVFGAEDVGLSPDWLANDFAAACLPVRGVSDSLNVAATAAVMLYEAVRQRQPQ